MRGEAVRCSGEDAGKDDGMNSGYLITCAERIRAREDAGGADGWRSVIEIPTLLKQ